MKNESAHIAHLISKYICGTLTVEDEIDLQTWLSEDEEHQKLVDYLMENDGRTLQDLAFFRAIDVEASWKRFLHRTKEQPMSLSVFQVMRYAIALVVVISLGWTYITYRDAGKEKQVANVRGDILPGGNKATLLLSDQRTVELSGRIGAFREKDGTTIANHPGMLDYDQQAADEGPIELIYNTLLVPKAGIYQLTLSDGTRVWVNALSQLRFPVQFGRDERKVFLSGEAYFEISRDVKRPFKVVVEGSVVEVLGTTFNVSTYNGLKATLVEGGVKVIHGDETAMLRPGQEAQVDGVISVAKADVQKAIAWKNGDFYFRSDPIHEIMDQLARWYDFSVSYRGAVPEHTNGYNGRIRRDVKLSEVLKMLNFATGANFIITDRNKVIVDYGDTP